MFYLMCWIAVLLIGSCTCSSDGNETLDVMFVYRRINSSSIFKEVHRRTNARNIILRNGSEYLDKYEGMMPLECIPASVNCGWEKSEGWTLPDINIFEESKFVVNLDEVEETKNERGETNVYKPTSFEVGYKSWFVIPPKFSTVHVTMSIPPTHRSRDYYYNQHVSRVIQVYEITERIDRLETFDFNRYDSEVKKFSTESKLKITCNSRCYFQIDINFTRQHLTLFEDQGHLRYDFQANRNFLCVLVIYKQLESNHTMFLNAVSDNGETVNISTTVENPFGDWEVIRFTSQEKLDGLLKLQLNIFGRGTVIHSISGCSKFDVAVTSLGSVATFPETVETGKELNVPLDATKICLNGGHLNSKNECVCPEGFTGRTCETGCGPYYVGNCTQECSSRTWGCARILFCKKGLPCLCAPGFTGENCERRCNSGTYGANCTQKCGNCNGCDVYSGYCFNGCEQGYKGPYCQMKYSYFKSSPIILSTGLNEVWITMTSLETNGVGTPKFYQVQYRNTQDLTWTKDNPQILNTSISRNVKGLFAGIDYVLRIVLIDEDGNSYEGDKVPEVQFRTHCTEPSSQDYDFVSVPTDSEIQISWKYVTSRTECPITGYTITCERNINKIENILPADDKSFTFANLMPGVVYRMEIRANTKEGPISSSATHFVRTQDGTPGIVTDLRVTNASSRALYVSWSPPRFPGGAITSYLVGYECLRLLACDLPYFQDESVVIVDGNRTSIELTNLQSHAQYRITVAAKSENSGPFLSTYGLTQDEAPGVAPEMSDYPILSTNTSVTVQWLPSTKCSSLNGYIYGYHYQLVAVNNTVLLNGTTSNTSVTFTELSPLTPYVIHVYLFSSAGWNENKKLTINVSTTAAVPDKVQNLSVYKRGRRMLGLRWAEPKNSYGEISSFAVTYRELDSRENAVTVPVEPKHCEAWPKFFCYTISKLVPNKLYMVSVSANNSLIEYFGDANTVMSSTSEGVPEAPNALQMYSRTTDSLTIQWKPPNMFNGVLRSFLINAEQTDSVDASNCCDYVPLHEMLVKSEDEAYFYEISNLKPASKYSIAVSAKTTSIGESASVTLSTPPEVPEFLIAPEITGNVVTIQPVKQDSKINGTYLLLVILPTEGLSTTIWNEEIAKKLKDKVGSKSFYIAEEYASDDLVTSLEVEIGKGSGRRNGTFGVVDDLLLPESYSVGLAAVLEYNGAPNVGFVLSETVEM